jgi:hypothetical protein
MEKAAKNCRTCIFRANAGSNTVHSKCTHPRVDYILSDHDLLFKVMELLVNDHKILRYFEDFQVQFNEGAIANRYALFPFNFDPRWLEECTGYVEGENSFKLVQRGL